MNATRPENQNFRIFEGMPMTNDEIKARVRLEKKADRLSVKVVSMVAKRIYNGELAAYDGIEAARKIRSLLIKQFA